MRLVDHNGKELKKYDGNNVRITQKNYDKLRRFIVSRGWKIGWFFEQAAIEKMEKEQEKNKNKCLKLK